MNRLARSFTDSLPAVRTAVISVLGRCPDGSFVDLAEDPTHSAEPIDGTLILRLEGYLNFANIGRIRELFSRVGVTDAHPSEPPLSRALLGHFRTRSTIVMAAVSDKDKNRFLELTRMLYADQARYPQRLLSFSLHIPRPVVRQLLILFVSLGLRRSVPCSQGPTRARRRLRTSSNGLRSSWSSTANRAKRAANSGYSEALCCLYVSADDAAAAMRLEILSLQVEVSSIPSLLAVWEHSVRWQVRAPRIL
jgi:hypothetical protein